MDKEKIKARKKQYYLANKEHIRRQQQEYQRVNRDKNAALQKGFRKRHPDKAASYQRKRRAYLKNCISKPYTVVQILNTYGTNCHICHSPIDLNAPRKIGILGWRHGLHIDHLTPISKGGSDTLDNVRPAHGACNLSKAAKQLGGER